jgi:hypothetical protein
MITYPYLLCRLVKQKSVKDVLNQIVNQVPEENPINVLNMVVVKDVLNQIVNQVQKEKPINVKDMVEV